MIAVKSRNSCGIRDRTQPVEDSVRGTECRCVAPVQKEYGSFDRYVWQFVKGEPQVNLRNARNPVPARTAESDAMSKDLKKRGFNFVGSTICYAFMQAVGMVDDHVAGCFRHGKGRRRSSSLVKKESGSRLTPFCFGFMMRQENCPVSLR